MKRFDNKIVLVTGGVGGIGLATVKEFLNEGAYVYFTDISEEKGQQLEAELGKNTKFIKHDVASENDWKKVIDTIKHGHKRLDVLANIAGIVLYKPFEMMNLEDYLRVVNINQTSVFLGQKYAIELLKNTKDSAIVNVSSIAGLKGGPAGAAYHSSKAAVISLTESAALEFANYGIRVNSISPGAVDTNMLKGDDTKAAIDKMVAQIPLKRVANPKELARVILFLASNDASYITGANIVVDGGSTKA